MLISSKNKNEKIVLGLLSYTFPEGSGQMDEIKALLESYRENPSFDILLYKDEQSDNFIGLLCIEENTVKSEDDTKQTSTTIIVHKVAVVPSFRNEGVGYKMYELIRKKYPETSVIGAMNTVELLTNWGQQYNSLNQPEVNNGEVT